MNFPLIPLHARSEVESNPLKCSQNTLLELNLEVFPQLARNPFGCSHRNERGTGCFKEHPSLFYSKTTTHHANSRRARDMRLERVALAGPGEDPSKREKQI